MYNNNTGKTIKWVIPLRLGWKSSEDIEPSPVFNGDFISLNLYAYCGNNPIARKDDGGEFWTAFLGSVIAGAVIGAGGSIINSLINQEPINLKSVAMSAAIGAVQGGICAVGMLIPSGKIIGEGIKQLCYLGISTFNAGISYFSEMENSGNKGNAAISAGATFLGTYASLNTTSSGVADSYITSYTIGVFSEGLSIIGKTINGNIASRRKASYRTSKNARARRYSSQRRYSARRRYR
ncbi:MAG: hypothetical protein E7464_07370 [Ruminococcaceae bacterium]|nr:hypothetical protein [Oscillospiraceae bacterium]